MSMSCTAADCGGVDVAAGDLERGRAASCSAELLSSGETVLRGEVPPGLGDALAGGLDLIFADSAMARTGARFSSKASVVLLRIGFYIVIVLLTDETIHSTGDIPLDLV